MHYFWDIILPNVIRIPSCGSLPIKHSFLKMMEPTLYLLLHNYYYLTIIYQPARSQSHIFWILTRLRFDNAKHKSNRPHQGTLYLLHVIMLCCPQGFCFCVCFCFNYCLILLSCTKILVNTCICLIKYKLMMFSSEKNITRQAQTVPPTTLWCNCLSGSNPPTVLPPLSHLTLNPKDGADGVRYKPHSGWGKTFGTWMLRWSHVC